MVTKIQATQRLVVAKADKAQALKYVKSLGLADAEFMSLGGGSVMFGVSDFSAALKTLTKRFGQPTKKKSELGPVYVFDQGDGKSIRLGDDRNGEGTLILRDNAHFE